MNEQEQIKLVAQAYEQFKNGNIQGLLGLFSDDIEWRLPEIEGVSFSGARGGRDQVAEFFASLGEMQEPLRFEPREFIAQGGRVVVLGNYEWHVKTTNRNYSGEWAHVWTVKDGKLANFNEYTDTAACARAYQMAANA
ncbi:MAG TPA: nuclear transport factor 2 family protein [Blastocatellia bacterium]|nr:nuclear transport factor 2 family protein [Blastocatellia bacterium]